MKLDASYLHFISQQQLRVLTSIELGMRNHQWVPAEVIGRISKLRGGETYKVLRKLLKNKFIVHTGKRYDGYKLAYLGYDYLALQTFIKRGILKDVICKIGVGKESDIYKCITPEGDNVVLKLTRLGRNSFRSVKKNRQYIQHRTNYNWLYLSRLSSIRQFLFMQLLHQNKFETPRPIDTNRHATVMSLVEGDTLCHFKRISSQEQIKVLFEKARQMLIQFARNGLIHGDYNEFNLITNQEGTKLTVIDFPQCISINHPNADIYFNRDVECVYKFFDKMVERQMSDNTGVQRQQGDMKTKRFILNVADYPMPVLSEIEVVRRLDRQIKTKGHITLTEQKQLQDARGDCNQPVQQQEEGQQYADGQNGDSIQQQDQLQSDFSDEQSNSSEQQRQNQGTISIQSKFEKQMKKMSFDQVQNMEIVQIQKSNQQNQGEQIYDKQLELLMNQLNHKNLQPEFTEDGVGENPFGEQQQQEHEGLDQSSEHQRPQFKGMTAYQIRIKIKEEKRLEREKRKQQMTEDQFIKNAVKRSKKTYNPNSANNQQGNRGNKNRNKEKAESIKHGYQML